MKRTLILCLALGASLFLSGVQAQSRFTVSADGQEVSDARTGLIWRHCVEGMAPSVGNCTGSPSLFFHEEALQHAVAQASATGKAWRLPNIKELSSLVDKTRSGPATDPAAFPATPAQSIWSSTPYLGNLQTAWVVAFFWGDVYSNDRTGSNTSRNPIRLVRNSP